MSSSNVKAWQGIFLLGLLFTCYWFGAFDDVLESLGHEPTSREPLVFSRDGEVIEFTRINEIERADQRQFSQMIEHLGKKANKAPNDAAAKFVWIKGNDQLCADERTFEIKRNWVGKVLRVSARDSGEIDLTVRIANGVDLRDMNLNRQLNDDILTLSKSDFVTFAGNFKKGDISQNQCLATFSLFSEPLLTKKTFQFKFGDIQQADVSRKK